MYGQVLENRVLYQLGGPKTGNRYRQIVVVEMEQFQVHILEGEVIQPDPYFVGGTSDAEIYFHQNLKDAVADAEKESSASVAAGWVPYP